MADAQSGGQGAEVFEGEASTPEAVALALSAMTFALGRRFIIVDGVERWKDKDLDELERGLESIAPDTTVAFFAREEGRTKAPERLRKAVLAAGGDVAAEANLKSWELPKWVRARASELGLSLDGEAAAALVRQVGERQQRLLRELEKLALELGQGARVGVQEVEELSAPSAERRAWSLADALVAGEAAAAIRIYLALRAQGERVPGLIYWMSQRLRSAVAIAGALDRGESAAQIKGGLRMPPRAADRLIGDARNAGSEKLTRAVQELADLELASRGGGSGGAGEDTAALLAIGRIVS